MVTTTVTGLEIGMEILLNASTERLGEIPIAIVKEDLMAYLLPCLISTLDTASHINQS